MMLKKIRLTVACIIAVALTLSFVDISHLFPANWLWLTKIQFGAAVLRHSLWIVFFWFLITLLLGRIYCSSVCPLGTFQDVVSRIARGKKRPKFKYKRGRKWLQWLILVAVVASLLAGFGLVASLLDPYSAYGRIATQLLKPLYIGANNLIAWGTNALGNYQFYVVEWVFPSLFAFGVALLTFVGIALLAAKRGRTWCNSVCPVGTILGVFSQKSFLKVRIDTSSCTGCGACERVCKASCIDARHHQIDYDRCVTCFNCLDACKQEAIHYSRPQQGNITDALLVNDPLKPAMDCKGSSKSNSSLISRRRFLSASTLFTAPLAYGAVQNERTRRRDGASGEGKRKQKKPIAPPGALSVAHLNQHCTACHLCIAQCPSQVLKPTFLEYGIAGMLQPTLSFDNGFCNYDCTRCSEVCPNGALLKLSLPEKHRTQIGHVVFIAERCIVTRDETSCGACSEHCPTQALSMIPYKGGLTIPHVNKSLCIGCGGCEYVCPAIPEKAVFVTGMIQHKCAESPIEKVEENPSTDIVDDFGF